MFRKVLTLILVCSIALYSTVGTCFPSDLNYPGVVKTDGEVLDVSNVPEARKKNIYVKGYISKENKLFVDAIAKMKTFNSKDYVTIHIDSEGGDAYMMSQFIEAMYKSKATYVAINEGNAISAAAIIAVQCEVVISVKGSYWLFHMARYTDRRGIEVIDDKTDEIQTYVLRLLKTAPLTHEEWDRMSNKKFDVVITGHEMNKRYGNKAKIILKSTPKARLEHNKSEILRNLFEYLTSIYSKTQEILELQPT